MPAAAATVALLLAASVAASVASPAAPSAPPAPAVAPPDACITSLREFAFELSSAVETGDVNRLAALYRWRGTPTRAGYDTMARLQAIVAKPLLQVTPVYPQVVDVPSGAALLAEPDPTPPLHRGPPAGLRLDQTLDDGTTPAPTTFWLRRDLGCWWVTL